MSEAGELFEALFKLAAIVTAEGFLLWLSWPAAVEAFNAPPISFWQAVRLCLVLGLIGAQFRQRGGV